MKKIILIALFTLVVPYISAQTHQLSSHILDISTGKPAPHVIVKLYKLSTKNTWETVSQNITDTNGRITNFLPYSQNTNQGTYKLTFETLAYFQKNKLESFYPFVEVAFTINNNEHYHVPITISPFGYSTYKGN